MSDILDELGLGGGDTSVAEPAGEKSNAAGGAAPAAAPADGGEKTVRKSITVNSTSTGVGALPAQVRGFGGGGERGSKYPFKELTAPVDNGEGGFNYSFFTVKIADTDADEKSLKSAVQSAVAAQNKSAKEDGSDVRYVTRTIVENGAYIGSSVYRVDATLEEEAGE